MRAPQNTNRIQTYKSYTHKVVSRTPLPVGSYNSSTVKVRGVSNLNNLITYNNMTLKNRSIFDSLNIEKRNYVYVEQVPNSNVIYYDSNLKKYRTLSETLKNPSNAQNSLNISNQRNFLDKNKTININKAITQNNRYNQTKNCICDHYQVVKPSELEKAKNERMNRTAISTNIKSNINMSQTIRSNRNQTSSSRNQAVLLNENQDKRYHSQSNKVESKKEMGRKNNNEENNQNKRRNANNETRNNRQSNQVNKRDDKEKNKNENNSIPIPQKGKVYQEDIISGRKKDNKDINSNNTNINANANKLNSSDNKKLEKPHNYAPIPINKSKDKEKEKEQNTTNKNVQNLPEVDIQQLEKNQSPYKNEEIVKDENGEIIKKKEEKTIVILPGQTIEPKSVIETFEKPIIEVVQNEDGTSQSVFKQTKIITTMENIPINNLNNSGNNGDGDLQLIKQIITYEYKTVSTAKDKLEKSDNKNKEENKENNMDNINNEKNEEKAEGKEENNNDMNDKKDKTNLRYMDLEKEENSQKEDLIKENQINEKEKENKKQTDIKKDTKDKNKNKDFNLKSKNKNVSKNEQKTQNKNVKEETDSKSKNIKSGSTEQKSTKNEKSKIEKEKGKNLKEKSENESTKKKSDSSKAKDKKDINKEKASKESTNKELTSNNKKGKNNEETNLGKPLKKNKKEEKDAKKSESSGDYKIVFELYEKCFKLGNKPGSEKDLEKIVEILIALEEKERKDILSKLLKAFPKSSELNQKIIILINKKISKSNDKNKNKDNQKGKEKGGKLSLEKETAKERRSKSQMKQVVKKNNLKAEEGAIKNEINKKLKLGGENSIKSPSKNANISPLKFESHSVITSNIGNLNFDGLFMDISKYQSNARYENPFRGPSSFYKFYKIRQTKIKKKLNEMTSEAKNNSEDKKDSQK